MRPRCYPVVVRSVADELRQRDREAVARRSPAERVLLALSLGDEDVATFRHAAQLDELAARRALRRRKQHGRVRSRSAEGFPS